MELGRRDEADLVLDAGTVLTREQANEAAAVADALILTPGTTSALAEAVVATGAASVFGVHTPTKAIRVLELGADAVNVFRASPEGPRYVATLRAPLPDLVVMPTGGVSADIVQEWFAMGAFCVGAGGELCSGALIAQQQWEKIERRAHAFTNAAARART